MGVLNHRHIEGHNHNQLLFFLNINTLKATSYCGFFIIDPLKATTNSWYLIIDPLIVGFSSYAR